MGNLADSRGELTGGGEFKWGVRPCSEISGHSELVVGRTSRVAGPQRIAHRVGQAFDTLGSESSRAGENGGEQPGENHEPEIHVDAA